MPAEPERHSKGKPASKLDLVLASSVVALCALVVAALAWSRPARIAQVLHYTQSASLSYTAALAAGSPYGSPVLHTGQPIYTTSVSSVALTYSYRLSAPVPASLAGTEQLVARIDNGQGLVRSIALQPQPVFFRGSTFVATARLDLASLQAIANAYSSLGGVTSGGSYQVTISPQVHLQGHLGAAALSTSFDKGAAFSFDGSALVPGTGGSQASASSLRSSSQGVATVPGGRSAPFLFGLGVGATRILSLAVLAVAAGMAGLFGLPMMREANSPDERRRILARHGSSLVETDSIPGAPEVAVVELSSFEGLLEVSRRLECPVLYSRSEGDVFAVVDNTTLYRYRIAAPGAPPADDVLEAHHWEAMAALESRQ